MNASEIRSSTTVESRIVPDDPEGIIPAPTRSDVYVCRRTGDMPQISAVTIIMYDEGGWTERRAKTLAGIRAVP
ncbi:MAG: hypothetical protein KIS73_05045 [Enhydrobacter sp.]|nr:hypothetical protein [Enhydrobacter sp.]